ncbi:MAG: hypothetical protein C5B52_13230 [Bacteroidetes bacterium]|nr:MAG: hypothetical protein C5B52_13230 [Bacteroidota bacterium]
MRKHILAIDDSKPIRFLLQTIFRKNYKVTAVPDGYSAMYFLQHSNIPDLIVVDAELPDMKKWEFIEHLNSSSLYGNIPIIVLSTLGDEETKLNCMRLGVMAHFQKPFNPVQLIETADKVLQTRIFSLKP